MRPNLVPALFNARRYSSQSSIQEWISSTLAQSPTRHTDTIDPLRASHLLRTLPTRQHSPPSLRDGDELVKGGNMIYFQPETMLSDLGRDGSSTVSHAVSHHLQCSALVALFRSPGVLNLCKYGSSDNIGIQCTPPLYT
jgi:hypothetical protein